MLTCRYMQRNTVRCTKEREWTSEEYFQQSMRAYLSEHERERRVQSLQQRRSKLTQLLANERTGWERELSEKGVDALTERVDHMRGTSARIKSARSEKDKQVSIYPYRSGAL